MRRTWPRAPIWTSMPGVSAPASSFNVPGNRCLLFGSRSRLIALKSATSVTDSGSTDAKSGLASASSRRSRSFSGLGHGSTSFSSGFFFAGGADFCWAAIGADNTVRTSAAPKPTPRREYSFMLAVPWTPALSVELLPAQCPRHGDVALRPFARDIPAGTERAAVDARDGPRLERQRVVLDRHRRERNLLDRTVIAAHERSRGGTIGGSGQLRDNAHGTPVHVEPAGPSSGELRR